MTGAPLAELPELTARLRRIDGAELVALTPPTSREMTQHLLLPASRAGVTLDADLAREMAARCRGDVRLAQGAIARLRLTESTRG